MHSSSQPSIRAFAPFHQMLSSVRGTFNVQPQYAARVWLLHIFFFKKVDLLTPSCTAYLSMQEFLVTPNIIVLGNLPDLLQVY